MGGDVGVKGGWRSGVQGGRSGVGVQGGWRSGCAGWVEGLISLMRSGNNVRVACRFYFFVAFSEKYALMRIYCIFFSGEYLFHK